MGPLIHVLAHASQTDQKQNSYRNFLIRCRFIKSHSTNTSQHQISASSALLEAHWESVCWALLKQQGLSRWARVTMSLCLFWDQLRQYSQVWANLICATYKNIFLEENIHTVAARGVLDLQHLALTLFFYLLTLTLPLICVNWFLVTFGNRTDLWAKEFFTLLYQHSVMCFVFLYWYTTVNDKLTLNVTLCMYKHCI